MRLIDKALVLVDSDISAYRIEKETGVHSSTIIKMRHHKRLAKNLHLGTAEKLGALYDDRVKHDEK